MITINLSEEQAKKLLHAVGSRALCGSTDEMIIDHEVARELFTQLDQKFSPRPTDAAETAKWLSENGYTALKVHNWKRKNESMESAFANYAKSVAKQVTEKYK